MDKETQDRLRERNQEAFERLKLWARQSNRKTAGDDGEALARKFFVLFDFEYEDIDQSPEAFDPELKAAGGKRADFLLKTDKPTKLLFVDAKQPTTGGGRYYRISQSEFLKYQRLQAFEASKNPGAIVEVALMVFPKEALGMCFAIMWLDYFEGAKECTVREEKDGKMMEVPGWEVDISNVLKDSKTVEPWSGRMALL